MTIIKSSSSLFFDMVAKMMMTRDELYSYCKIFSGLVEMTAGPKTSYEKGGEYVWKRNKIAVARAFFTPCHLWIQPLDEMYPRKKYDRQTIICDFLSFFFVLISVQRFCQRQI